MSLRSAVARSRGVLCETSITHREEKAGRRAGVREEGREEGGGREGGREGRTGDTRGHKYAWEKKRVRVLTEHCRSERERLETAPPHGYPAPLVHLPLRFSPFSGTSPAPVHAYFRKLTHFSEVGVDDRRCVCSSGASAVWRISSSGASPFRCVSCSGASLILTPTSLSVFSFITDLLSVAAPVPLFQIGSSCFLISGVYHPMYCQECAGENVCQKL